MGCGANRLADFVAAMARIVSGAANEEALLEKGAERLASLVRQDDWLPDPYARPDPDRYGQHRLHVDGRGRFSILSFAWGPGQATPVHDHRVWGLVGVLRGGEQVEDFGRDAGGRLVSRGPARLLLPGTVERISPAAGDIHRVANACRDRVSVSIHVYGADIGTLERATYDGEGQAKPFVSGYSERPALIP